MEMEERLNGLNSEVSDVSDFIRGKENKRMKIMTALRSTIGSWTEGGDLNGTFPFFSCLLGHRAFIIYLITVHCWIF